MDNHPILRVGVVGAGAVASSVHLPILSHRSDLFEVEAIADFNLDAANALADRFAIPAGGRFEDPQAMFTSGLIDAAIILNSGSHADLVVQALGAGLHVFCEKPLGYSEAEMSKIEVALKSSGKQLMLGYMKTFDQATKAMKANIKGRPRAVDVVVLHPSGENQLATSELHVKGFPASAENIKKFTAQAHEIAVQALGEAGAKSIGSLYANGIVGSIIHEFSVLRELDIHMTKIDFAERWMSHNSPNMVIQGRTDDDVRVSIRWLILDDYPLYQEEIRWVNEDSGHHLIFPSPYILRVPTKYVATTRVGLDHINSTFESYMPSFEIELEAFHTLTQTGKQQGDPIKDGREDMQLCQKIAAFVLQREGVALGGDLIA